jgi:uncharacterized cupin superfamily protein
MADFTLKSIGEMESINAGMVKLAGAELGVQSFGIQVFDFPAGFSGYPEHDHADDGQEEVYVVLNGSAEFELNGQRRQLDPQQMMRVDSHTRRRLVPGPDGVRILAIGSTPHQPYERPHGLTIKREER